MVKFGGVAGGVAGSGRLGFSLFAFLWKYKFWIALAIFIVPNIIGAFSEAHETDNYTMPFFKLAVLITSADNAIERDVELLRDDPSVLVGVEKPSGGLWSGVKYYWLFFWNVFWRIANNVYFLFFPLIVIFKLISGRNVSEPYKNFWIAAKWFLLYMFVTNVVIFTHGVITDSIFVDIPEGGEPFSAYLLLLVEVLPFHGVYDLVVYLVEVGVSK